MWPFSNLSARPCVLGMETKNNFMRNFIILAVLMAGLASCSKEPLLKEQTASQKWVLIKMTSAWGLGSTMGPAMQWQEYFIFNSNGTFTKYRQQDNVTKSATGTYAIVTQSEQQFIELTYTGGDNLSATCFPKEQLLKVSETLLQGTWGACDGPTLEYTIANETEQ